MLPLSLPPSYGLGHQIPEDDAKKCAPTPASTRAQPTPTIPCRKNMKTQCLSLHIVTIYSLVLKRTKKKSQATTDDHNCSNCNSSIYFYFFSHIKLHNAKNKSSKLCHDRMDKKHRRGRERERDSSFSSFNFLAVVEKSKTNEEKMAYKNGNT